MLSDEFHRTLCKEQGMTLLGDLARQNIDKSPRFPENSVDPGVPHVYREKKEGLFHPYFLRFQKTSFSMGFWGQQLLGSSPFLHDFILYISGGFS